MNLNDLLTRGSAGLMALCLCACASPAFAADWQGYLSEEFSGPESMFYTGQSGEAYYSIDEEGRYLIDGMQSAQESLSALTDNLYYYYAEAECQVLESTAGDLAFCGVVFHYNKKVEGKLAYYVFYLYGDGYYGAKRILGESIDIIIPLTRSDLIERGRPNVLAVDAQGTRFDLYINGRFVDGFTDVRIDGGGFGFYISKQTRAAFDNFEVKVERRGGGPAANVPPAAGEDSGGGEFSGYQFPDIPRDPNREPYPWEVGVDKSKKGKKQQESEEGAPPPDEPVDDGAEDEGNGGEDGGASQAGPREEEESNEYQPPSDEAEGSTDESVEEEREETEGSSQDVVLIEPAELEDMLSDTVEDIDVNETPVNETPVRETTGPDLPAAEATIPDAGALEVPALGPASPDTALVQLEALLAGRNDLVEIRDDFSSENWPVSDSGASIYRYASGAYEVNNLAAQTMAISYQQETLRDFSLEADVEYLDGVGYVGYGLAGRFSVGSAGVSYYGAFISQSGELLFLKVTNGAEQVLYDWAAAPTVNAARPNRLQLVLLGDSISVYINGELAASVNDGSIASGGYAVMAGPGVAARFDNLYIRGVR